MTKIDMAGYEARLESWPTPPPKSPEELIEEAAEALAEAFAATERLRQVLADPVTYDPMEEIERVNRKWSYAEHCWREADKTVYAIDRPSYGQQVRWQKELHGNRVCHVKREYWPDDLIWAGYVDYELGPVARRIISAPTPYRPRRHSQS